MTGFTKGLSPKSSRLAVPEPPRPPTVRALCRPCRRIWVWDQPRTKASRRLCSECGERLRGLREGDVERLTRKRTFTLHTTAPPPAPDFTPIEAAQARRAFYFKLRKQGGERSPRTKPQSTR